MNKIVTGILLLIIIAMAAYIAYPYLPLESPLHKEIRTALVEAGMSKEEARQVDIDVQQVGSDKVFEVHCGTINAELEKTKSIAAIRVHQQSELIVAQSQNYGDGYYAFCEPDSPQGKLELLMVDLLLKMGG